MMLTDLARGDIAAIVWPKGSDYVDVDRELRGTEQLVQYCGPWATGGKRKRDIGEARGAFVRVVDPETLLATSRFCIVENVEVVEVVEARHQKVTEERTTHHEDLDDPLRGRVR